VPEYVPQARRVHLDAHASRSDYLARKFSCAPDGKYDRRMSAESVCVSAHKSASTVRRKQFVGSAPELTRSNVAIALKNAVSRGERVSLALVKKMWRLFATFATRASIPQDRVGLRNALAREIEEMCAMSCTRH